MTLQESEWLQQLHDKLAKHADVFGDSRYNGIWDSIIDKYSDQAHFLYELLQNADDAGATWVRFELHCQKLVFRHNGTKLFTVSNPETEPKDQQNGNLGHVNAIAAIGMSQKLVASKEGNQIGKFGIGFKSVFRYTNTPQIYDDRIWFRLERRIVPSIIDCDYTGRQSGETIFVLPFDNGDAAKSYSEVACKLRELQYPLLFLKNLMEIRYCIGDDERAYVKECSEWHSFEYKSSLAVVKPLRTRLVRLKQDQRELQIQLFTRLLDSGEEVSIGYVVDSYGRPVPQSGIGAFCFFQTDVETGLKFFLHAPFLLTDNRQGIKDDSKVDSYGRIISGHNARMIHGAIGLAADAIWAFTKLGEGRITDSVLEVIPARKELFNNLQPSNVFRRNADVIQRKFIDVFKTLPVIPVDKHVVMAASCFWPFNHGVHKLLSSQQLENLFGKDKTNWGFTSFPGVSHGILPQSSWGRYNVSPSTLGSFLIQIFGNPLSLSGIVDALTDDFVQQQTDEWRSLLYEKIVAAHLPKSFLAQKGLLLDQEGRVSPAYDKNGHVQLWLPTEGVSNVRMLKEALWTNPIVRQLAAILELKQAEKPSRKKRILKLIADTFATDIDVADYMVAFKQVFDFWREDPQSQIDIIAAMKKMRSLYVYRCLDHVSQYIIPNELYPVNRNTETRKYLYLATDDFDIYLAGLKNAYIVKLDEYVKECGASYKCDLLSFLKSLGMREVLAPLKFRHAQEPGINFCETNFRRLVTFNEPKKAANCKATWNLLLEFIRVHCKETRPFLNYMMYKRSDEEGIVPSSTLEKLQETTWIIDSNGSLRKPSEIHIEEAASFYNFDTWPARQLADAIGFKRMTSETLSDTDRLSLELGRRLKAIGISEIGEKDIEKIKQILQNDDGNNTGVTNIVQSISNGNVGVGTVDMSFADGQYAGLSKDEQRQVNKEALEIVKSRLSCEGFDFSRCKEEPCRITGAVDSEGQERPLVVHSAKKDASAIFLSAADVVQMRKPNALLIVVTKNNVLIRKTLQDLVGKRERLVLSFSVSNLDSQARINCFADSLRYFKGLRFKFDILSNDNGIAQFMDSPENSIPEGGIQLDSEEDL